MANLLKLGRGIAQRSPEFTPSGSFLSSEFGKIIFAYRVRASLTQVQLAEKANVSTSTIHRIEGGSGGITDHIYAKVFKVLGIGKSEIANFFLEMKKSDHRELLSLKY